MSLYKRGNIWWISFTTPLGQRIRESGNTTDRRKASKFLDKRKAELWQMDLLCKRPEKTWNEAAVLWLNETTHKATQIRDREILNWLEPYL
ncbi:MAG TPA: hypothetical protein VND01_00710, partial [Candidatus Acidoferrales bacterium]|nr:hypothetical protein [Candidatus Acidoferrales bacterium]